MTTVVRPWVPGRRRLAVLAVAVVGSLIAAACGGGGGGDDSASPANDPPVPVVRVSPTEAGPQGKVPQFAVECDFSHAETSDPIVHWGHTDRSHLHNFFGNTTADPFSTVETLEAGDTTCDQKLDLASYWAPALIDGDEPVEPVKATAYYRPGVGIDPTTVEPYPYGIKMIGGDQGATEPQSLDVAAFACGTGSARTSLPQPCPEGRPLRLLVSFPDCWDGENLDSDDHVSHTARSVDGACPASHPVPMPQLLFAVDYPITGDDHDLSLASGSPITAHADFFNAWDEDKLRTEVESCLHRGLTCNVVSNRQL